MSSVARAVCPARVFTSLATTENPRPASPARAASIVALSARRFVWSAIDRMRSTTSPMASALASRFLIVRIVWCAVTRAFWATPFDSAARAAISAMEAVSCVAPLETMPTFDAASPTAALADAAWRMVVLAVLLSVVETASRFSTAWLTDAIVSPIPSRNEAIELSIAVARRSCEPWCSSRAEVSRPCSTAFWRKISTMRAMSPTSSRRVVSGMVREVSPSPSASMDSLSARRGRVTLRPTRKAMPREATRTPPPTRRMSRISAAWASASSREARATFWAIA